LSTGRGRPMLEEMLRRAAKLAVLAEGLYRVAVATYHRMVDAGMFTNEERVDLVDGVLISRSRDDLFRIPVDMYHRMIDAEILTEEDTCELIEGVLVDVSPQSREHAIALRRLSSVLIRALTGELSVRVQMPLSLVRSEPEPDLAVVPLRAENEAPRHPRTAELVVEVAKTTLRRDRGMVGVYAEAGVREYWIVDGIRRRVEVFRSLVDGAYGDPDIVDEHATLHPLAFPDVAISVATLFAPPAPEP